MQSSITVDEGLCEKCCELLNAVLQVSSTKDDESDMDIDHYKVPTDLQASADGGCRGCQIFWMHMSCGGIGEYSMLTIKQGYLEKRTYFPGLTYGIKLENTRKLDNIVVSINIPLLNKKTSYQEIPPILRLASGNIDDELTTLMQTTIKWIDNCSQNHEKCQRIQGLKENPNIIPTRLIDVQSNDGSTARLVNTKELASDINPKYLILSYCWGMGNQPAKTTRSNLCQRRHRIMVYDLPKTIQDAITITRLMGIRYLWVDALCIIQPDNDDFLDDWNSEAAQMGNYYSNALFCISALYASDSSEGFLGERHSARYPWREEEAIQYGENFVSFKPLEGTIGDEPEFRYMPLMRRAWALQERILSTQRLHWSGVGLLWECDSGLFQENQPFRNLRKQQHSEDYIDTDHFMREILSLPKEEALGVAWLGIIFQYASMKLTKPTDRLAAIHGVARRLSLQHNVEYFGGIFKGFYSRALPWQCMRIGHERDGFILKDFPSWSWASAAMLGYSVDYDSRNKSLRIKDLIRYADPEQSISLDEIIDFRDRSKRKLLLKAPLVSIKLRPPTCPETSTSYHYLNTDIEGPIWRGQLIFCQMDYVMESPEPSTVTLLICNGDIREGLRTALDSAVCYRGIVLRRSEEDGPNAFVRLGFFSVSIPWSEEEEEGGYLNEWERDVCLF
ncbi:heterokaryon incompatibility domain-containing protein [Trichoderma camerunense]